MKINVRYIDAMLQVLMAHLLPLINGQYTNITSSLAQKSISVTIFITEILNNGDSASIATVYRIQEL